MAIDITILEAALQAKIDSADGTTDNKDLLLISKSIEGLDGSANHLKPSDLGVTVQAHDVDTVKAPSGVLPALSGTALTGVIKTTDIDVSTIVVDGDIGTTVEAFDADTVKAPSGVLPALDGAALTGIDSLPAQSSSTTDFALTSDGTNATWTESSGGGGAFATPLASGTFHLSNWDFGDVNWTNTNTSTYGWLIQRTNGMSGGKHQFAVVQGGARDTSLGGCRGTILPFQLGSEAEGYAFTAGTPTIMWTNSSSGSDFSTCSVIDDGKSGKFHYSGNIPWPNNSSHTMGYGHGALNTNNTAGSFWDSGTDQFSGIHNHNGHFRGVSNSAGTGWKGCHSGYANGDGKTRIHNINFDSGMSTSVMNPSANTSTSPAHVHHLQYNSELGNTALVGVTHYRNSSNQIVARVFGTDGGSSDHNSGQNWDVVYSSSNSPMVSLSTGKTIVWHGSKTYLYTSASSRTEITAAAPPFGTNANNAWCPTFVVPVQGEPDTWYALGSENSNLTTIYKYRIDPNTYEWTDLPAVSQQIMKVGWSSYQKLMPLTNNNHFFHMWRTNKGKCVWQVLDLTDMFPS